jgi:hypothetical protein
VTGRPSTGALRELADLILTGIILGATSWLIWDALSTPSCACSQGQEQAQLYRKLAEGLRRLNDLQEQKIIIASSTGEGSLPKT